jgi:predicted membrane protein
MNPSKIPKYINAFVKLMIFSAVLHLAVLAVLAVYFLKTGDGVPLNFFSIVGLSLFFPVLVTSPFAGLYSTGAVVFSYTALYFFFSNESRRTR